MADPTAVVPTSQYTSGNSLTQTGSSGTQVNQGQTQNEYTAGQQALQNSTNGVIQSLLSGGGLPQGFQQDPAVWQSMLNHFNQDVAPQLAAQYGAGSPVIGGRLANLLLDATAQNSQQGWTNLQNTLGAAQSSAYTPVGTASSSAQSQGQTGTLYNSAQQNTTPGGGIVSSLANSAGALLSNAGNVPNLPSIALPGGAPGASGAKLP